MNRLTKYGVLVAILSLVVFAACEDGDVEETVVAEVEAAVDEIAAIDYPTFEVFAPPDTYLYEQPDFDYFAWNTFIAMNWPAIIPSDENGFMRGYPDQGQSFLGAQNDSTLVWETFKEKREVFNFYNLIEGEFAGPGAWNAKVDYGVLRAADQEDSKLVLDDPSMRTFHQSTKSMYNSLDETIEVKSESLEPFLPNGEKNPVFGKSVAPRVWLGEPDFFNGVLYEVKVNFDYYKYVKDHALYIDIVAQSLAVNGDITLPYRTSSENAPGGGKSPFNAESTLSYSAAETEGFYTSPDYTKNPPPIGSFQLKAAWIRLGPDDETSEFHISEAQYFVSDAEGKPTLQIATFGLVGLHIIQRIHTPSKTPGKAGSTGGSFVFATWEHVLNDEIDYTYSNFYDNRDDRTPDFKPPIGWYPSLDDEAYPVTRRFEPISNSVSIGTQQVNEDVHDRIRAVNPNSVWLNYRLIGTQFQAIDVDSPPPPTDTRFEVTENDPTGIGQQAYLANLVIETNDGLQFFRGMPPLPPGFSPIAKWGLPGSNIYFNRDTPNTTSGQTPYNMGGCMGCHGVAQQLGYSFSFVLLGGSPGATTDTQTRFDLPE